MRSIQDDSESKGKCFNFFINLFDNGEFNELFITQGADGYQVNLDNETYLGTLARTSDHCWELIKGTIPSYVMNQITQRIDRVLE